LALTECGDSTGAAFTLPMVAAIKAPETQAVAKRCFLIISSLVKDFFSARCFQVTSAVTVIDVAPICSL